MREHILRLRPEQLRATAKGLESDDPDGAAELRKAADAVERGKNYSTVRPAYRVTWMPAEAPAAPVQDAKFPWRIEKLPGIPW